MKTLQEIFERLDIASKFRIRTYGTPSRNKTYDLRKRCLGLGKEIQNNKVYKVITTKDYNLFETRVDILIANKAKKDCLHTIFETKVIN